MRQIEVREEDYHRLRALALAEDSDVPETVERLLRLVRPERMPKLEGYLGRCPECDATSSRDECWRCGESVEFDLPKLIDVGDVDVPGSGDVERRRLSAAKDCLEQVREAGEAKKDDLLILASHRAGGTYEDRDRLWAEVVEPVLADADWIERSGDVFRRS